MWLGLLATSVVAFHVAFMMSTRSSGGNLLRALLVERRLDVSISQEEWGQLTGCMIYRSTAATEDTTCEGYARDGGLQPCEPYEPGNPPEVCAAPAAAGDAARDVLERLGTPGGAPPPPPSGPPSPLLPFQGLGLTGHCTPINNENHKNFASAPSAPSTFGDPRRGGWSGRTPPPPHSSLPIPWGRGVRALYLCMHLYTDVLSPANPLSSQDLKRRMPSSPPIHPWMRPRSSAVMHLT